MSGRRIIPVVTIPARVCVSETEAIEALGYNQVGRSDRARKKALWRFMQMHGIPWQPGRVVSVARLQAAAAQG